jgi:radical SAM protein with 4Fe4S-binding SPASM domain
MDDMRAKERQREGVNRSHASPERCRRCGYRSICDQAIK